MKFYGALIGLALLAPAADAQSKGNLFSRIADGTGLTKTGTLTATSGISFTDGSYIISSGGVMQDQSFANRYSNVNGGDWYMGNAAARINVLNGGTDCAGAAGVMCVNGVVSATDVLTKCSTAKTCTAAEVGKSCFSSKRGQLVTCNGAGSFIPQVSATLVSASAL